MRIGITLILVGELVWCLWIIFKQRDEINYWRMVARFWWKESEQQRKPYRHNPVDDPADWWKKL